MYKVGSRKTATIRENPETSRAGTRWTEQEEAELIESLGAVSIDVIALQHKRTLGAIRAKRNHIAYKLIITDGLSIEDVSKMMALSVPEMTEIINEMRVESPKKVSAKKAASVGESKRILELENRVAMLEKQAENQNSSIFSGIFSYGL